VCFNFENLGINGRIALQYFIIFNILLMYGLFNDKVKEDEMGSACSTNGTKRNAYTILVRKPERRRPLGRPRHRWVDNIKRNLRERGWGGMDWIDLA
jgi:hypothetical protein